MKLNPDCVRDLLIECENLPYSSNADMYSFTKSINLSKYTDEDIYYSMEKLIEAGFVNFKEIKSLGATHLDGLFLNITWEGHQFLDTIKSDTVWNKTKEKIASTIEFTSLTIFSTVAASIAQNLLGL